MAVEFNDKSNLTIVEKWRSRGVFISFLLIFVILSLWPFFSYPSPGLIDYHNHLARLHILTGVLPEGWSRYYEVRPELVPNLALDILARWFVVIGFSPEISLRIFSGIAFFSIPLGALILSGVVNRNVPWMALLAFPFAFNLYFIYGFLNYILSIGLALLIIALWVKNSRLKEGWGYWFWNIIIASMLNALLVCHLMGYGLALATMSLYELGRSYPFESKNGRLASRIYVLAAVVLPSIIFYLFMFDHSRPMEIQYFNIFRSKVIGIISPFLAYYAPAALAAALVFFLGIGFIVGRQLINAKAWPSSSLFPVVGLFLLFLVVPSAMLGSYSLDRRLFICVAVLFLSFIVVILKKRQAVAVAAVALGLHVAKIVEISCVWKDQSRSISEASVAIKDIPVGSKVGGVSFTDTGSFEIPPLRHVIMLALIERSAFVPNLFAQPFNGESVAYKEGYIERNQSLLSALRPDDPVPWGFVCEKYEYFLLTYMSRFPKTPDCLQLMSKGSGFNLYSIKKHKSQ